MEQLDTRDKLALCFGSEEPGLSADLQALADETVRIPIHGFTRSYNLSVSAGDQPVHSGLNPEKLQLSTGSSMIATPLNSISNGWLNPPSAGESVVGELPKNYQYTLGTKLCRIM